MSGPDCLTVMAGVLTEEEFACLTSEDQARVEESTRGLITRYGWESLQRDRDRHRQDLWLAYGVPGG